MAGPVVGRTLVAVAAHDHEMVAGAKAHRLQSAGKRFDLAVPFGIGPPQIALDDRLLARLTQNRDGERATQIHRQRPFRGWWPRGRGAPASRDVILACVSN